MSNKLLYLNERVRQNERFKIDNPQRINSKVEFFNDATGERIWEPLHNKTVIAGAAFTMMKLFNFSRSVLENTPTYDNPPRRSSPASADQHTLLHGFRSKSWRCGSGPEDKHIRNTPYARARSLSSRPDKHPPRLCCPGRLRHIHTVLPFRPRCRIPCSGSQN